jgi:hypothetical protein
MTFVIALNAYAWLPSLPASSRPKGGIDMTRFTFSGYALIVAAVAAISMAGGTAGFAAELPSYEVNGFPISPVQAGLLGAAKVREQPPISTTAASPHQSSILTAHRKLTAATAPTRTETGRAIR